MCAEEGVDAVGLNFVRVSPRFVDEETAREIVTALGARVLVVGVIADMSAVDAAALRERLGLGCLQLHGNESPESLSSLLPHAYKAVRVAAESDVMRADDYGGEHVLLDSAAAGKLGGSGTSFEWSWARTLSSRRRVTVAGGLHAGNVRDAIRAAAPYCVDSASGVEVLGNPRRKDRARLRAFIAAVR